MRRILVGALLFSAFIPTVAMAQAHAQSTCEQRLAVMGQIVEDMSRARAIVSTAEVEAASLKVQVKDLQQQLQASTEKKDTKETKEKK
jgi:predicted  nucleic acid-binding Zn-ribbon protein